MNKSNVVARLTAQKADGMRLIVEVQTDASFSSFYRFYSQVDNRRSTKKLTRTANRNTGLPATNTHACEPGLNAVAEMLKRTLGSMGGKGTEVQTVKVRIIRRKIYRALCQAAPDTLGMAKDLPYADPRLMPRPVIYPMRIPSTFKTTKEKWSILTGRE